MISEELVRPTVKEIKEYVPGKSIEEIAKKYGQDPDTIIKLGSNENPLGPSPHAVEAIKEKIAKVHLYPPDTLDLRKAIGNYTGYPAANIVVGKWYGRDTRYNDEAFHVFGGRINNTNTHFFLL